MVDNRIKIFGASDCYGLSDDLSFTIRAEYIMRDEVDYISLRKAVDMLEERFGFLKVLKRICVSSTIFPIPGHG